MSFAVLCFQGAAGFLLPLLGLLGLLRCLFAPLRVVCLPLLLLTLSARLCLLLGLLALLCVLGLTFMLLQSLCLLLLQFQHGVQL